MVDIPSSCTRTIPCNSIKLFNKWCVIIMQNKRVVLVTGPPGNGRDEYLQQAIKKLEKKVKTGYYHVFEYMQEVAPLYGVHNLTRDNVFIISKSTLERIRNDAFSKVVKEIQESDNEIDIVSTPAVFRIRPWGGYLSGRVDGLTIEHIEQLRPTTMIVFIDDLLRVRENMRKDAMWQKALGAVTLKDLAEWRHLAIELVQGYAEQTLPPKDWIIFAKEHRVDTFVDLLLGEKPRIYLSYHITGHEEFTDVQRFMKKLSDFFICIDPYTIKDWDVVKAYDDALRQMNKDAIDIEIKYSDYCHRFSDIPLKEIEEAIDLIRTQIVERDFQLIANVHATVVYHRDEKPSYGVMAEIIHSLRVDRPVYLSLIHI